MGLFGPSKKEIADAVAQALAATLPDVIKGITLPAPDVTVLNQAIDAEVVSEAVRSILRDGVETSTPEIRPARGWEVVTEDMLGKPLPVRPHALWANGPMTVTLVDDIGTEAEFSVMIGGHPIDAAPVQIDKIVAEGGATLLALFP